MTWHSSKTACGPRKSGHALLGATGAVWDVGFSRTEFHPQFSIRLWLHCQLDRFLQRPKWRESVWEIGNCFRRIRLLWTRVGATSVHRGMLWIRVHPEGLCPNTTRLGRIQDTERLLAVRPWASLQDQQLFLCGWEAGREWAIQHRDADGEETIGYSYSSEQLLCDLGGNSMPPSVAQQ